VPRRKPPKYRHHRQTDQAFVEIKGKRHYLGRFNSPASLARYEEKLRAFCDAAQPLFGGPPAGGVSINELLLAYLDWAEPYYGGGGRSELANMRQAVRRLSELALVGAEPLTRPAPRPCGEMPAAEFRPNHLRQLRDAMLAQHLAAVPEGQRPRRQLARTYINETINRVRRIFRWAVGREHVPASVFEALRAVEPLKAGRSTARETEPIRPVDLAHVEAVLPFVAPPVRMMIRLQRLTGMRSDNLTAMRLCDVDQSADVWVYRPTQHKTKHRGHELQIPLGSRAQQIIFEASHALTAAPSAYLFSPAAAKEWHFAERRGRRKSKVPPSQANRRKKNPQRAAGPRYTTMSYRAAIVHGIAKARKAGVGIPHWHPHQLRHTWGTEIRRRFGLEAAQVALGHKKADVTQIYAERDFQRALEIARELG